MKKCAKVAYGSRKQALAGAEKLLKKHGRRLNEYKCQDCGKFHLTKARMMPYTVMIRLLNNS